MFFQKFAIVLPIALGAIARPKKVQQPFKALDSDGCIKGVHIVGVRGTLEDRGHGALKEVVDQLKQKLPGSDDFPIDYPASGITIGDDKEPKYNFFEYSSSESQGYGALKTHLEDYKDLCPETDIVLLGYSQGAHVLGDVLCGSYGFIFPHKPAIDSDFKSQIRAVIQLGDPTNRKDMKWHVGNSTNNGLFPRLYLKNCDSLGSVWQSYCDENDTFCDAGESIEVHKSYVEIYRDRIVDFVVSRVQSTPSTFWNYRGKSNDL